MVAGLVMASMASSPAWAELLKAADWQMNEDSGQMLDSSGNNNNGTPKNVVQGVKEDIDGDGQDETIYRFNGLTTPASRVEELDVDSYDVVRKGFITTEGGDYKMEIKRVKVDPTIGRLHCFFRGTLEDGTDDSVARVARPDVVDGTWHTLRCEKTSDSVVATVDGRSFTATGSADSIDNASDVWVGAKTVTLTRRGVERGDDVFDGSMDYVRIDITQPDSAQ